MKSFTDYVNEATSGNLEKRVNDYMEAIKTFGKPNQAIFARLRTFNNSAPENNEAFYQFQFGYKFSIGTRAVKK